MPEGIKEKTGTEGANAENKSEVAAFQGKRNKKQEGQRVWPGRCNIPFRITPSSDDINWDRAVPWSPYCISEPLLGFPLVARL